MNVWVRATGTIAIRRLLNTRKGLEGDPGLAWSSLIKTLGLLGIKAPSQVRLLWSFWNIWGIGWVLRIVRSSQLFVDPMSYQL